MSHAPTASLERRHQAVREASAAAALDALVVTSLPNVLYLTNFSGSAAIVVVTRDRLIFVTDSRYVTAVDEMQRASHRCPDLSVRQVEASYDQTLVELLTSARLGRVGFEAAHLSVARHRWLTRALERESARVEFVATEGLVERARVRKDAWELDTLREAGRRLSRVTAGVFEEVRAGRSEREVALAIDQRLVRAGFEKPAFDTIVAGGPNAALPHAQPGERTLSEGDLVVLDFGGVYDSYCVDLTRTVSVGRADGRAREVHAAVREAHDGPSRRSRPGESRFAIDAGRARGADRPRDWARRSATGRATAWGSRCTRSRASPGGAPGLDDGAGDERVEPGWCSPIEPGAYLPGWGGVRIEDDVAGDAGDGQSRCSRTRHDELTSLSWHELLTMRHTWTSTS